MSARFLPIVSNIRGLEMSNAYHRSAGLARIAAFHKIANDHGSYQSGINRPQTLDWRWVLRVPFPTPIIISMSLPPRQSDGESRRRSRCNFSVSNISRAFSCLAAFSPVFCGAWHSFVASRLPPKASRNLIPAPFSSVSS